MSSATPQKILFKNAPPQINLHSIGVITDKNWLIKIEEKYQAFIVENQQLLMLHDIIEDFLDIRDAMLLQIDRLNRLEKKCATNL
jgi:hypothetical protein